MGFISLNYESASSFFSKNENAEILEVASNIYIYKPKTKEDIITFVSTHNPNNPNMWPLVSTTLSVLKTSQKMEKVLQNTSVINSKRQPHNLKRILTRAKFSTNHTQGGSFKCNDKRCGTCQNIEETTSIKITATDEIFQIRKPMNCKSKNVLYIITCKNCKAQYTGKTNTTLAKRTTVHRSQIKNKEYRKLGLSKHLEECNKNCEIKDMFSIVPFYKVNDNESETLVKEQYFTTRFKTTLNNLTLN